MRAHRLEQRRFRYNRCYNVGCDDRACRQRSRFLIFSVG